MEQALDDGTTIGGPVDLSSWVDVGEA